MLHKDMSETPKPAMTQSMRWGLALPFAVLITIGLGAVMASLIAAEFIPQDKRAVVRANINPVAVDIFRTNCIVPPRHPREIEVPPPPPSLSIAKTESVNLSIITPKDVVFELDWASILPEKAVSLNIDSQYQPIVRAAPIMPLNAHRSGHCRVRFDVSSQGLPFNIELVSCTDRVFARNTIKSVENWKYLPKTVGGRPITVENVENIVRFNLTDERGRLIPEG